jgi:hypothetical protein
MFCLRKGKCGRTLEYAIKRNCWWLYCSIVMEVRLDRLDNLLVFVNVRAIMCFQNGEKILESVWQRSE